jgi:hypothetical protein
MRLSSKLIALDVAAESDPDDEEAAGDAVRAELIEKRESILGTPRG